ncbi:hypothetical protein L9F63_014553, partial [Diploptera punctata]
NRSTGSTPTMKLLDWSDLDCELSTGRSTVNCSDSRLRLVCETARLKAPSVKLLDCSTLSCERSTMRTPDWSTLDLVTSL